MSRTARHTARFGVIGLGVTGENLALNVEDNGWLVAIWDHNPEKVDRFMGAEDFMSLSRASQRPRRPPTRVPEPTPPRHDRDEDEVPEAPPTEPKPAPVKEAPDAPRPRGPYVVD